MALVAGSFVRHTKKPEWGLGRIVAVNGDKMSVLFLDIPAADAAQPKWFVSSVLALAAASEDPRAAFLPEQPDWNHAGMSWPEAVARFGTTFPRWFEDPRFLETERNYKWEAHLKATETLAAGELERLVEARAFAEIVEHALKVVQATNLVSPYEKAALADAVRRHEDQERFAKALKFRLYAPHGDQARFDDFVGVLGSLPAPRSPACTWTTVTILPFLLDPAREMFLKPTVTQEAAARLRFDLRYRAEPNWQTYSRLLSLNDIVKARLAEHHPRDNIDTQSFIWCVAGDNLARF